MKVYGKLVAAAVLVAAGFAPATAGEFDKQIKSRKAIMQLYAWNLGTLGAMAKEAVPYDAETAKRAAANLLTMTGLGDGAMWPKGSDSTALGEDVTRAKAEAWAADADTGDKHKALSAAAAKMAEVAGNGLEAVQGQMKAVGDACGGCHKKYRVEKK